MTAYEQNEAIAVACGWKKVDWLIWDGDKLNPPKQFMTNCGHLPDFLNDLNAMREAEQTLTPEQFIDYVDNHLFEVCRGDNNAFWSIISKWTPAMVHASAAQRAESFLRTLNLWRD